MWDRYDPRSSSDRDRDDFGDRNRGSRGGQVTATTLASAIHETLVERRFATGQRALDQKR